MSRKIYLSNTDLEEALSVYLAKLDLVLPSLDKEMIPTWEAGGRMTASPIFARISSPNHNASAMDGIMVISERTYSASETTPVMLIERTDFVYVNTGNIIAPPYDAVIMIEDLVETAPGEVRIIEPASPWQHIRPIGEDIVAGEMILPENHLIKPMDIGAILSGGIKEIKGYEKVRVGIMPTGNEISDDYDHLEKGKIFDTNSWTFKAIVENYNGLAERISPVADEYQELKAALLDLASRNHIVVVNAGSSAGTKDYAAELIAELGEVVLHGIAIKPGKPTILGIIDNKPVIGVPGYPGSAFLVFEEIVLPVILKMQKNMIERAPKVEAILSRRVVSSLKYRDYVRVKLGKVGEKLIATPLSRGAGVTMAIVKADGLMIIPKNSEGFDTGEKVQVELTSDMSVIENTLVSIGSHDLIMDLIGNKMAKKTQLTSQHASYLSSAHVGSMGGIMALKRGEAHIAPIHLLDESTGEYNLSYIDRYLGDAFTLIKGVRREQGIMTLPGNPKGILTVRDLARKGVVFVNRQKGSGTRILTDYLLKKDNLENTLIRGYDREMTTHMAVAAAVESGTADAGIGVYSAAKAMGLDFISIGYEDYDFAVSKENYNTELVSEFIAVLRSEELLDIMKELGGYGV